MLKKILIIAMLMIFITGCTACSSSTAKTTAMTDERVDLSIVSLADNTPTEAQITAEIDAATTNNPPLTKLSSDDINAIIDKNLKIIVKDNKDFSTEQQFINAHLNEFNEIVALGEDALPYLKIISTSYHGYIGESDINYCAIIAMAAAYKINPELYELEYPSPDGKYALKAYVVSFSSIIDPFGGITYKVGIINYETGSTIISSDDNFCNFSVEWSPDSKYASISQSYRYYYQTTDVFDIKNALYITLPDEKEVEDYIGQKLTYIDANNNIDWRNTFFSFNQWDNGKIKIQIDLMCVGGPKLYRGWYIYDLINKKIVEYKIIDMTDETATMIKNNLNILAADFDDVKSEIIAAQEAVAAHPDEFVQIIQLGENALPYLANLKNFTIISDDFSYNAMAAYVEYVIKPELYDIYFPSPDGKYSIKASKIFSLWAEEICDYNDIKLIECSTGKVICDTDIVCRNIKVDWSPSKQYAVLSHGISGYSHEAVIVDIINAKFIILPGIFEVKQLIVDKNISVKQLDLYEKCIFVLDDWLSDDKTKIQISFYFSNPNFKDVVSGRYIYDLKEGGITDIEARMEYYSDNTAILSP